MTRNNYKRNIGSVSSGTMRPEDLIPSFTWELSQMRPLHRAHRTLLREIDARMASDDYYESEESDYDLEKLFSALEEYALPYMYFGAHPGNGSDYGFWLSENFEEDFADASTSFAKSDGSIFPDAIKVNDLSDVPQCYTGKVLHVSDHGNPSLYAYSRGRGREVWSLV